MTHIWDAMSSGLLWNNMSEKAFVKYDNSFSTCRSTMGIKVQNSQGRSSEKLYDFV